MVLCIGRLAMRCGENVHTYKIRVDSAQPRVGKTKRRTLLTMANDGHSSNHSRIAHRDKPSSAFAHLN